MSVNSFLGVYFGMFFKYREVEMLKSVKIATALILCFGLNTVAAQTNVGPEQFPRQDDCKDATATPLKEGCKLLDDWLTYFVDNDAEAFANVNHYPHVRITNAGIKIWNTRDEYFKDNTAEILASKDKSDQYPGWVTSRWNKRQLIQYDNSQMHFAVEFTRFDKDDKPISILRSFYILTNRDGRWGIQARSSFAGVSNKAAY